MSRSTRNPLFAVALSAGLSVAGPASGQTTCDPSNLECPPAPPPTTVTAACSPGYFKNHVSTWCDAVCPWSGTVVISGGQCTELLDKLNATGRGAGILKNQAGSYINAACFVTRELSPCEDD